MISETGIQFLQLDLGFLIDLRTSTSTTKTEVFEKSSPGCCEKCQTPILKTVRPTGSGFLKIVAEMTSR